MKNSCKYVAEKFPKCLKNSDEILSRGIFSFNNSSMFCDQNQIRKFILPNFGQKL